MDPPRASSGSPRSRSRRSGTGSRRSARPRNDRSGRWAAAISRCPASRAPARCVPAAQSRNAAVRRQPAASRPRAPIEAIRSIIGRIRVHSRMHRAAREPLISERNKILKALRAGPLILRPVGPGASGRRHPANALPRESGPSSRSWPTLADTNKRSLGADAADARTRRRRSSSRTTPTPSPGSASYIEHGAIGRARPLRGRSAMEQASLPRRVDRRRLAARR